MCTLWRCKYRHRVSRTNNYCAKFKSLPSAVFRFIVPTYLHTYPHIHYSWQSDHNIVVAVLRRWRRQQQLYKAQFWQSWNTPLYYVASSWSRILELPCKCMDVRVSLKALVNWHAMTERSRSCFSDRDGSIRLKSVCYDTLSSCVHISYTPNKSLLLTCLLTYSTLRAICVLQ